MRYQELTREIKTKTFHPVYLFTGPEAYIADMMEKTLKAAVITPGMEQLNYLEYKDKKPDLELILQQCNTLPMMSLKRMVVLRGESGLTRTTDQDGIDAFIHYLENPNPDTLLIIFDEVPDKRKRIYKALKKAAAIVEFEKLNRMELEKWILSRFKRSGKTIARNVLNHLVEESRYLDNKNKNIEMVDNELGKLIDYAADHKEITNSDIDVVIPKSIDDNIFKMIDYAISGNKGAALEMLGQFYLEGESPFGVFALLVRQVRSMLMVRALALKNTPPDRIAKEVKLAPFIVKKMLTNSRKYPLEKLKAMLMEAAALDLKLKTGKVEPEFGVEWYMIKL